MHWRSRTYRRRSKPQPFWLLVLLVAGGCFLIALAWPAKGTAPLSQLPRAVMGQSASEPLPDRYYTNCRHAHSNGRYNIRRGEPGYRPELDRDGDGLACEPYRGR